MDKETMKKKRKGLRLKGQMKQYLKWPAYYNAFWLIITVVMFAVDIKAGIFMALAEGVYLVLTVIAYLGFKPNITKMLVEFGADTVRFKGICFVNGNSL